MDRMHVICLLKKTGHLKCCSSNYTCKTAVATLISIKLETPETSNSCFQLPKIIWYFLSCNFRRYIQYILKKIHQNLKNQPTRQNVTTPKFTSWIPPVFRWFAEPQTPSAGSAVRSPLLGWWPLMAGRFFLTKKETGKAPGFLQTANPFFRWLAINWMMNQPNLYIKKMVGSFTKHPFKKNGCLGYQAGHL